MHGLRGCGDRAESGQDALAILRAIVVADAVGFRRRLRRG